LVKGVRIVKHIRHSAHLANIPTANILTGMFKGTAMTVDNMDNTLRGWAKLDTAAGESTIQSNVTWGIANYTDATARQYLIDTYL
jgi:hypothetical protein